MKSVFSERAGELPVSTLGKLIKISVESGGVISLGPGEPDFVAPRNIIEAAKKALDGGHTHYSPPGGRAEFLELLLKKVRKDNRIKAGPENIMATTGSTEGILLTTITTTDAGEGVMISDPGFLAYKPTVEILNGMPISVPLFEDEGWQPSVDRMNDMAIPEKTNMIIINTPCNPTGVVYTKKVLEDIAGFAVENDLIILSDEAYEDIVYDGNEHISIGSLNGMEDRVMSLFTFSKTYAMAGFRLGYAVGPEKHISAMKKLKLFTTVSAPTVSQIAAVEALKGPQMAVEKMRKEYARRRKMVLKRLDELGLPCTNPGGAFYAFPNIKQYGMPSLEFSEWLLKNAKVAVVPGTEFGRHGEGYIRISYATKYDLIEKAFDRMEKALKKLK